MSRRFRTLMIPLLGAGGVAAFAPSTALADPARRRVRATPDAGRSARSGRTDQSPGPPRARRARRRRGARRRRFACWFPANPVIAGGGGAAPGRPAVERGHREGLQYFVHAEQTVEIGGQRSARREVVSRALRTAELRVAVARAETRARVRAAYVGTQLALARVDAATQREALVASCWRRSARASRAARRRTSISSWRGWNVAARPGPGSTRPWRRPTPWRACGCWWDAAGQKLELDAQVAVAAPRAAALPALLGRAQAQRAELAALASGIDEIDADITRLRREAIPSPTLFADLQRDLPGQFFVGGGVAIPIPLWRRQQGELAVARADRTRVQEERTLVERDVALEVERAFQSEVAQRR